MPRALIDRLFALGNRASRSPRRSWRERADRSSRPCSLSRKLSRVDPSVAVLVDVQNTLVVSALLAGHARARRPRRCRAGGRRRRAYALSEAASGSDAFALETRARDDGQAFVLTGRKLWITNAAEADLFIVFATVDPAAGYRGITAFVIDRETPGFSVTRKEDKLGIRASSTCEIVLDDCRVPRTRVLGDVGKGYKTAIETLNEGRIGIAAQMLGLAEGALATRSVQRNAASSAARSRSFRACSFSWPARRWKWKRAAARYDAARSRDAAAFDGSRDGQAVRVEVAERTASLAVNLFAGTLRQETTRSRSSTATPNRTDLRGTSNLQLQTSRNRYWRRASQLAVFQFSDLRTEAATELISRRSSAR